MFDTSPFDYFIIESLKRKEKLFIIFVNLLSILYFFNKKNEIIWVETANETLERLGTIGLLSNFMVYLTRVFRLEQVDASNVINIWSGFTNLTPLVGAFISDAYIGRFTTIAFASFATLFVRISNSSLQFMEMLTSLQIHTYVLILLYK